MPLKVVVNVGF